MRVFFNLRDEALQTKKHPYTFRDFFILPRVG